MLTKIQNAYKENSGFRQLLISILATGLGYGLYKGIIDNYLAEIVVMGEMGRGVAEFFRELPGLLIILILALLYRFSAETIYKIGAVIMVVGLGLQTFIPADRVLVIMAMCIYSLGEHIQLGMKNTLSLSYCRRNCEGQALGIQNSCQQIGTLFGYAAVLIAFIFVSGLAAYKAFFAISTGLIAVGMVMAMKLTGNSETDKTKSRFCFRRKFRKYYMLEVFYGARKQVFFTFGPYVLILFYGANASVISLLYAVSAICCTFTAPVVGRIIDRFGYRIVMIGDTLILVIVCFFYGFAHHIFSFKVAFVVCCINYVCDSVISQASMASNVYVKDIADNREEMMATISTGISVNHMITIFIALFGGWIWHTLGIETLFMLSAVLGLCNSAYAATIKVD